MKLKEEWISLPKDEVYDRYLSIVYSCKDYDKITRGKMIDEILKQCQEELYIYYLCTKRELDFLSYVQNHKVTKNDLKKYSWEIKVLYRKGIFSNETFTIYEEQQEAVLRALDYSKTHEKRVDDIVIMMVAMVKVHASMLSDALISMMESLTSGNVEIERLFGNPLFHFYCFFYNEYMESFQQEKEFVGYRDYDRYLDELEEARKEYGVAGSIPFRSQDYYDIFYYDYPISHDCVKKMVNCINRDPLSFLLWMVVERAKILNDRTSLEDIFSGQKLKIVEEGLAVTPCAAMNGFTPLEYYEEKEKEFQVDRKFSAVSQNNAHLCKNAADLYYKLYFALLDYINQKHQISPKLAKIYRQEQIDVKELYPVDEYLWKHKEEINDFIRDNPQNFTREELEIVKGFQTAVTSDHFVVVGFEREYTEILSDDGKLYMVKGVRSDFDRLIDPKSLPVVISTTLLMFQGHIIYNSFFSSLPISFGSDLKSSVLKDYEEAIRYYHL